MPEDYPDYPNHFQIAAYFDDYVDHFGLREKIRFRTEVVSVEPADGEWDVTVQDADGTRETHRYRAVLVANGHHWDPRWPEPPFPGSDEFEGEQMHVHHYREPDTLRGKRRAGAGDRQLGHRHRGRVLADRREDLPGDAARRLRPAQVPERQADRRSGLAGCSPGCLYRSSASSSAACWASPPAT